MTDSPGVETIQCAGRLGPHERRVERFYSAGAGRRGGYHDGFLNFGLWKPGIARYADAARALVEDVARRARLGRRSVVLDAGSGTGAEPVFLIGRFRCKRIDAVDATLAHATLSAGRARRAGLGARVRSIHGNACDLPFPAGRYTHVVSVEAAQHFSTRRRFLAEAYRLLRPGGRIALADVVGGERRPRWFARPALRLLLWWWRIPLSNDARASNYAELLRGSGFADVRVERAGDRTVPGYVAEQERPDSRRALRRIQGRVRARVGLLLDRLTLSAFRTGWIEYVLASARKPVRTRTAAAPRDGGR